MEGYGFVGAQVEIPQSRGSFTTEYVSIVESLSEREKPRAAARTHKVETTKVLLGAPFE